MTIQEAVRAALESGKAFKRPDDFGVTVIRNRQLRSVEPRFSQPSYPLELSIDDVLATDWELCERP